MNFADVKSLNIPEGKVVEIKSNSKILWQAYKNWVKYSTETDGVTIYNGGLGYKNGYRIRSGGAEGAQSTSVCTGFIPCKAGETIRVLPPKVKNISELGTINVYNASKTNLGQLAYNGTYGNFAGSGYTWANVQNINGVYTFTVPTDIASASDIAFVRITVNFSAVADVTGEGTIVTVNEEITV